MPLIHHPSCEGVISDSKGNLSYCGSTNDLRLNSELQQFCPKCFYEPTEQEPVKEEPYNPDHWGGYILEKDRRGES